MTNQQQTGRKWTGIDEWLTQRQIATDHHMETEAANARRAGDLWATAIAEARLEQDSIDWTPNGPIAEVIPLQQRGALVRRTYPDVIA